MRYRFVSRSFFYEAASKPLRSENESSRSLV